MTFPQRERVWSAAWAAAGIGLMLAAGCVATPTAPTTLDPGAPSGDLARVQKGMYGRFTMKAEKSGTATYVGTVEAVTADEILLANASMLIRQEEDSPYFNEIPYLKEWTREVHESRADIGNARLPRAKIAAFQPEDPAHKPVRPAVDTHF